MEFNIKSYGINTIPIHFCNFLIRKIIKFHVSKEESENCVEFGKPVAEFKHSEVGKPPADFTV